MEIIAIPPMTPACPPECECVGAALAEVVHARGAKNRAKTIVLWTVYIKT